MMPPTDDEYLSTTNAAMLALVAQVDACVKNGDRHGSRAAAAEIKALVARATEILGSEGVTPLFRMAEQTMARTVRALGTAAWEEPETEAERDARQPVASGVGVSDPANMASPFKTPAPEEPKPLSDEELDGIERALTGDASLFRETEPGYAAVPEYGLRLLAEVRCLRSKLAFDPSAEAMARARKQVAPAHAGAGYEHEVGRVSGEIEERLRGDEWLKAAADEIEREEYRRERAGSSLMGDDILAILRKHRDGKA